MPGVFGVTVVTNARVYYHHARLRAHRAPGIPCALQSFGANDYRKPRARRAARSRSSVRKRCGCLKFESGRIRGMRTSAKSRVVPCERRDPSLSAIALIGTPRPCILARRLTASAPTDDGGYGSPRVRGEDDEGASATTRLPSSPPSPSSRSGVPSRANRWPAESVATGP